MPITMFDTMRRLIPRAILPLLLAATAVFAHDDHDHPHPHPRPPAVAPAEAHRPSRLPDRIVLSPAADPARGAAVAWRTSTDAPHGFAQLAAATHGPEMRTHAVTIPARTEAGPTDLGPGLCHAAEFGDLEPGTTWAYRVGDGTNWSEWFQFATAPEQPHRFRFVHFGDAQNDILSLWSRVVREAGRHAPDAAFLVHSGDLVNRGEEDAQWGEWFRAGAFLHSQIPSLPIPGNHEYVKIGEGDAATHRLAPHWRRQFVLPENGPAGLEETCYTICRGELRFVALNSNEKIAEQAAWLDGLLAESPRKWIVCSFHHPIYSAAKNRDNEALRKAWKPVFDRHSVDLVLQGHDHVYGRTGPVPPGEPPATLHNVATGVNRVDAASGTVYVVSVSGPKQYDVSDSHPLMERLGEDTQLFQVVEIDGDELRFESRTAIGGLYDGFTLRKRGGRANEMIPREGLMQERRRPPKPAEPAAAPSAAP